MPISVLRRQTLLDETGGSSAESSRRPSLVDVPRKSSLAGLSLRLTRSKRTQSAVDSTSNSAGLVSSLSHRLDVFNPAFTDDNSRQTLGDALLSLPDEIITHIICHLSTQDFLALRIASRAVHAILKANAAQITRSLLTHAFPLALDFHCIQQIYPQPRPCPDETYLLQMIRRKTLIDRILSIIASFVQMKVYMIPSCPRFENFAPYKRRLEQRFHVSAWIIYHFLESFRHMLVFQHPSHPQQSSIRSHDCSHCADFVTDLVRSYPSTEIIPAYHFYGLLLQHLRQLSRAPSYVGTIERRLRGWSRRPPTDPQLAQVIIIGGIPLLSKLSVLKGTYNQRVEIIGSFLDKISSSAATQMRMFVAPKTKRSSSPSVQHIRIVEMSDFASLKAPLEPPFSEISDKTLATLPSLERFVSDDWTVRMYETIGSTDTPASAFGFVQNVLAGKTDGPDYLEPIIGFV